MSVSRFQFSFELCNILRGAAYPSSENIYLSTQILTYPASSNVNKIWILLQTFLLFVLFSLDNLLYYRLPLLISSHPHSLFPCPPPVNPLTCIHQISFSFPTSFHPLLWNLFLLFHQLFFVHQFSPCLKWPFLQRFNLADFFRKKKLVRFLYWPNKK